MIDEVPEFTGSHIPAPSPETRLGRFFQKINQFLKREESPVDLKLQGRIHELQTGADRILIDLLNFKNNLQDIAQPSIFTLVSNIIDPIIKDITYIQKSIEGHHGAAQQVKTCHRYIEWMEKAKMWIELGSRPELQEDILKEAILKHTVQEFHSRIKRDMQIIEDYFDNSFHEAEETKEEIKNKVEIEISPYISQLKQLMVLPEGLSFDTLPSWRSKADHQREKCFGNALHVIDGYVGESVSKNPVEHESEHIIDILTQLSKLEEDVADLTMNMENVNIFDERILGVFKKELNRLDEVAHNLNTNLRLPHEHVERVQQAIESLNSLRDQF